MWNLCGFLWRVSVVLIPLSEGRGRLLLSHLGRRGNQRACGWLAAWDKGWMRLGCLARRGYSGIREGLWEGGCWVAQPSHILAWGGHRTPKHARYIHATSPLPPTPLWVDPQAFKVRTQVVSITNWLSVSQFWSHNTLAHKRWPLFRAWQFGKVYIWSISDPMAVNGPSLICISLKILRFTVLRKLAAFSGAVQRGGASLIWVHRWDTPCYLWQRLMVNNQTLCHKWSTSAKRQIVIEWCVIYKCIYRKHLLQFCASKISNVHKRKTHSAAGWQKLREPANGVRWKVWTQAKILIPNIGFFVAI